MNRITLITLVTLTIYTCSALADEQPTTRPRQITVTSSPVPVPALKHRLLPDALELQPGNAATLYLVATSRNLIGNREKWVDDAPIDEWLTMAPEQLPRARVEEFIGQYHNALHQVELGARRETCHWDMPYRQDGFGTLLPHLGDLRLLGRVLALKARLQIADGKYDEAARTLQTGFGMARHIDQWEAFIVQMLVAGSIQTTLLDQVEFWISRPGSPNLTWPLATLPRPMLNVQGGMFYERAGLGYAVPELKSAVAGSLSGDELRSLLARTHGTDPEKAKGFDAIGEAIRVAARDTVGAKEYLQKEGGYKAAELDAMQPPAILGLYYANTFERWHDEMVKWYALPYPLAVAGLEKTTKEYEQFRAAHPANPLFMLMSSYSKILLSVVRSDRRVDELRCLEAIRAYATTHGGKLPASLRDVKDLPIPLDPVTGVDFPYSIGKGGAARLDVPMPAGGGAKDGRSYELRAGK